MTVRELIDYLASLDAPDTLVVLHEDDVDEPCEFIALDSLDYTLEPTDGD